MLLMSKAGRIVAGLGRGVSSFSTSSSAGGSYHGYSFHSSERVFFSARMAAFMFGFAAGATVSMTLGNDLKKSLNLDQTVSDEQQLPSHAEQKEDTARPTAKP